MTPQEIFDFIGEKLLTQDAPSKLHGTCAYRGQDGRRCAVGHLISDEMYDPEMDEDHGNGTDVDELILRFGHQLPALFYANRKLLRTLQNVHDNESLWVDRHRMFDALASVAGIHDISANHLHEVFMLAARKEAK